MELFVTVLLGTNTNSSSAFAHMTSTLITSASRVNPPAENHYYISFVRFRATLKPTDALPSVITSTHCETGSLHL